MPRPPFASSPRDPRSTTTASASPATARPDGSSRSPATREPAIRFAVIFSGPAVTADENDHYQNLTGEGETPSTLSEQEIDARVLAEGPGGVDPIPWIASLAHPGAVGVRRARPAHPPAPLGAAPRADRRRAGPRFTDRDVPAREPRSRRDPDRADLGDAPLGHLRPRTVRERRRLDRPYDPGTLARTLRVPAALTALALAGWFVDRPADGRDGDDGRRLAARVIPVAVAGDERGDDASHGRPGDVPGRRARPLGDALRARLCRRVGRHRAPRVRRRACARRRGPLARHCGRPARRGLPVDAAQGRVPPPLPQSDGHAHETPARCTRASSTARSASGAAGR